MIQIFKYFAILFLSTKISRERLKDFCDDHITRLTANNPGGIFNTILADVTTAYNAYFGTLSGEATKQAIQEGKTVDMNDARTALLILIRKDEKLFAYKYGVDSGTYQEFIPHGLTEYDEADLPTLVTIGKRLKDAIAAHSADFDAGFITEYNTAYGDFTTDRTAQKTAISNVDTERSNMSITKSVLCKQMTVNVLTIALKYVGDITKADVYFDQSILNAAFKEAETKVANDINPGETQNIFSNITQPTVSLKISNTGNCELLFGFEATETSPVVTLPLRVAAGATVLKSVGEMGFNDTHKFLNVTDTTATMGSYVVEKV